MDEDNVVGLARPGASITDDPLLTVLREGARRMLSQAIEAEVDAFLAAYAKQTDDQGRRRIVRNGHAPERTLQTGIGEVPVQRPRVRDRGKTGAEPIRFTSAVLPRYLRRSKNIEELLPWLYLKGISTGQFDQALTALLGKDAPGLSASTIRRLTAEWQSEHQRWCGRDLSARRFVYIWADGVYLRPRLGEARQCLLVLIGVDDYGKKELLAIDDGVRESEASWRRVLIDLRDKNGLRHAPELAIGDGAMGFWAALVKVWPTTKAQRCWTHSEGVNAIGSSERPNANVLNYLPKLLQSKAKSDLHDIYLAESRAKADKAFDVFVSKYGAKHDKAVACLRKDRDALLAFYDFPAEHWKHIRTANPIESTFATVRLRTDKTKGCLSRATGLAMVFKLMQSAEKNWRKLDGAKRLGELIEGVRFADGEPLGETEEHAAA